MKYKANSRRRAKEYEKDIVEWWEKKKAFEKSVEQRPLDDSYVFYDGPPFITGNPHHGTLLSSIVKDAVPRFWTMRGKRCERRWGWDCHGLPAENFVEKQLGITDRREIGTKWSLEEYITKARESMVANSETWESTILRIGRWVDFKGAYRTMDKDFMESVWWAFAKLYKAGKIFEGRKVLMYDTKFATPVSKAEVMMDNDAYKEVTDPSAYVKFKLCGNELNQLLARHTQGRLAELTASQEAGLSSSQKTDSNDTSAELTASQEAGLSSFAKIDSKDSVVYLLAWTTTPWTLPANMVLAVNPELEYGLYEVEGDNLVFATSLAEQIFAVKKLEPLEPVAKFKGKDLTGLEYQPLIDAIPKKERKAETYHVLGADFVSSENGTGVVHCAPAFGEDDYELCQKHEVDFVDGLDENGYYLPEMAEKLHELGVRDTDEHGIELWAANKFIAKMLEERGDVWKIEYIKHEYPFNPRSKQRVIYRAFPSWFMDIAGGKPLMLAENENINWFPEHLKYGRFAKNIEQAPDWNLSRDRFWATAMPVWKGDKGGMIVVGSYEELFELSGVKLEDYHRPWVDEVTIYADKLSDELRKKYNMQAGEVFTRVEKVLDCWFESGAMPFAQMHYPFENKEKFEANYPADFIVEYVGQVRAWFYYVHALNTALAEVGAFGEKAKTGAKNAYKNVITTGTLAGNDGRKMSKSLGNYTDPNELMDKFSADSLRFLLLSSPVLAGEDFALLDKDVSDVARKLSMIWNVYDFFTMYAEVDGFDSNQALKPERFKNPLDVWMVSRIYEVRNEITAEMEAYNLPKALENVLPLIDDLSNWFVRRSRRRFWKSEDDNDKLEAYSTLYFALVYLSQILAPFVPFLAEELYQQMTSSGESVHLLDWPEAGKIDETVLEQMARTRTIITEGLGLRMMKSEQEEQIKVRQPLASLSYKGEVLPEFYEQIIRDEVNVKTVKNGDKIELDKTLTEELKAEGFARELIRFVQSARKKAGLNVDDRIKLSLSCELENKWQELVATEVLAVEMLKDGNFAYDEIVEITGKKVVISLEKA